MPKKNLQIGLHTFGTKAKARDYIRTLFSRYVDGETILGEDDAFLRDLVLLHPEKYQKIGSGVRSFTIQTDPVWKKTRHFVLLREDGSSTDFSFLSCLNGPDKKKDAFSALRHAVMDQVVSFKAEVFSEAVLPICPYLGTPISFEEAHVDHTSPATFKNLVENWLDKERMSLAEVSVSEPSDNQWVSEMTDSVQRESWYLFHQKQASLRIISKTANLSHAKTQTPKNNMKTKLLAALLLCIPATRQLNAQVAGLPVKSSEIKSGIISAGTYDITMKDGSRQTGNIHSLLNKKGEGSIISWPDGGEATITRVRNGNAVIFGPSRY